MKFIRKSAKRRRGVPQISLFVLLILVIAGTVSGESDGESEKPSNGLIAFADAPGHPPGRRATPHAQIYTISPDGKNRKPLTTGKPGNFFPAWLFSDRIAYWSGTERGCGQVWTMKADGTDKKQLTNVPPPALCDNPTWSPDGKKILFDTQRRRRPEIWVMNADGSDQRVLVSDLKVIPMRTSWQPVFSDEAFTKPENC
ncbi:MAG: TolB family protein [Planctomycetota bacterium]